MTTRTLDNDSIERVRVLTKLAEPIAKFVGIDGPWAIGMGWSRSNPENKTFQVHFPDVSAMGRAEIFISPKIEDSTEAAYAIAEAFAKLKAGKGATTAAQELMKVKLGLMGEGSAVLALSNVIADAVSNAPALSNFHGAIREPVKQSTRNLKVWCPSCNVFRCNMSRKTVNQIRDAKGGSLPCMVCGDECSVDGEN